MCMVERSVVGQGALQHFDVWHIESRGGRTLCTNTAESISHVTQAGGIHMPGRQTQDSLYNTHDKLSV